MIQPVSRSVTTHYPNHTGPTEERIPSGTGILSLFLSLEGSIEEISELNTALRAGPASDTVRVLFSRLGHGERGIVVKVSPVVDGSSQANTQVILPGSSGRFDVKLVAIAPNGQVIRLDCPIDVTPSLT